MSPPARYFALCGALVGWALGVVLPGYGRWPQLGYEPTARTWTWSRAPTPGSILYYGLLVWGLGFAALGASLGAVVPPRARTGQAATLSAAWALTAIGISFAYFTFQLWP
jgi:hypothetical protein